jgi:hypothetical protein
MRPVAYSFGGRPFFITGGNVKIIFLDIDGVLVTDRSCRIALSSTTRPFDGAAVANLNQLVALTEAKVVISSAWRTDRSLDMNQVLMRAGARCDIVGHTPVLGGRGFEIAAWCLTHPAGIERFAILEDTLDLILTTRFAENLVSTTMESGFDKQALNRALHILGGRKVSSRDPVLTDEFTTLHWRKP